MFIYGQHAVVHYLEHQGHNALELMVLKTQAQAEAVKLARNLGISVKEATKDVLDKHSGRGNHQGVLLKIKPQALGNEKTLAAFLDPMPDNPLFLVLDSIQDPHNLGAILRSAAAFNVAAVIWAKDNQVGLTPVVRKVACGAAEVLPLFEVTNLNRALSTLKDAGVWLVATTVNEHAKPLGELDLKGPIALVMGAEGEGVRLQVEKNCDFSGYIPMPGAMESLNVSVATGVALYEAMRQRS